MSRIIIDVREPSEYDSGHAMGALNIPIQDLFAETKQLSDVSKDAELVLYCRTGSRSALAKNILTTKGYTKVVNGINKEHVEAEYGQTR